MEHWIRVEPAVRIYVNDIYPQGKNPILFLHGWPANHKMFEYQYNALVPKGYRCIGMDMRGFGKSDKPTFGYGYDSLADDVRAVIDALRLRV
jgi:non-heme chloroperoxidase